MSIEPISTKKFQPKKPANQANGNLNKKISLLQAELEAIKKKFPRDTKDPKTAMLAFDNDPEYRKGIESALSQRPNKGKLKALERMVGEKFMAEEIKAWPGISSAQKIGYTAAVFTDDLTSIFGGSPASILSKLAIQYGPAVLDWLYSKAKGKFQSYKPKGSGYGSLQYPMSTQDFGMEGFSMSKSKSPMYRGVKDANSVHNAFLACLFCPEVFQSMCPDQFGPNLCNSALTTNVPLDTDTLGGSLMYFVPDGATTVGALVGWWCCKNAIGAPVNMTTGVITTPVFLAGQYNATTATNVAAYRVTASATRIVFNLSATQNSGSCMLAYSTSPPNSAAMGTSPPVVSQNQALQFPYCHVAAINGTAELRQIHIPHSVTDLQLTDFTDDFLDFVNSGTSLDEVCINIVGGPASATVARVYATTVIDYAPGSVLIGINKPSPTPEGAGTLPCVSALLKRMPHLAQLTLAEATQFAEFIMNGPDNYADLVSACLDHASQYKKRPRESMGGGQGSAPMGDVEGMSFEIE